MIAPSAARSRLPSGEMTVGPNSRAMAARPRLPGLDYLARKNVGVDDDCAVFREPARHDRLT